jgi:hypothetical protein
MKDGKNMINKEANSIFEVALHSLMTLSPNSKGIQVYRQERVNSLLRLDQRTDRLGGLETLLHVQVGRRLVKHEDVALLDADDGDGEPLELASAQVFNVAIHDGLQVEHPADLLPALPLVLLFDSVAYFACRSTIIKNKRWEQISNLI